MKNYFKRERVKSLPPIPAPPSFECILSQLSKYIQPGLRPEPLSQTLTNGHAPFPRPTPEVHRQALGIHTTPELVCNVLV